MDKTVYFSYIDEAGNTGSDLINKEQPFFVMVAVLVPEQQKRAMETYLKEKFEKTKEKEETEIKGKSWCKSPKKQYVIKELISELKDEGGKVFAVILEKKYMIAGRIVQTFFDGVDNHTNNNLWNNNQCVAILTANKIAESFNDEEFEEIGKSFREVSVDSFNFIIDRLLTIFKYPKEIEMLNASRKYIHEIVENFDGDIGLISPQVEDSANMTVFNAICEMIAGFCKANSAVSRLIFDNCSLCNQAFTKWIDLGKKRSIDEVEIWNSKLYGWSDRIGNFSIEDSKDETLLQIADAIASSINHALISIDKSKTYDFDTYMINYCKELLKEKYLFSVMSNRTNQRFFNVTINEK